MKNVYINDKNICSLSELLENSIDINENEYTFYFKRGNYFYFKNHFQSIRTILDKNNEHLKRLKYGDKVNINLN